jgi:hypothetical protein
VLILIHTQRGEPGLVLFLKHPTRSIVCAWHVDTYFLFEDVLILIADLPETQLSPRLPFVPPDCYRDCTCVCRAPSIYDIASRVCPNSRSFRPKIATSGGRLTVHIQKRRLPCSRDKLTTFFPYRQPGIALRNTIHDGHQLHGPAARSARPLRDPSPRAQRLWYVPLPCNATHTNTI